MRKLQAIMNSGKFMDLSESEQDSFTQTDHIINSQLLTIENLIDELKHIKADEDKLYELFGISEQAEEYRFNLRK